MNCSALELNGAELKSGVYFLDGDDGFLVKTAEDAFRSLLPASSLSLYVIDRLTDVNEILSCIGVYNLDGTPNVVIVRDADAKLDEKAHDKLASFLSNDISPDYLVFSGVNFLTNAEKKLVNTIDCSSPDKFKSINYIEKIFPNGIERNAAALLTDYTENNWAKINNERTKLLAYCGENRVTTEDVEALVPEDKEVQVFAFANSIIAKNGEAALKQLEKMRKYGVSNAAILSSLSGQFQRMLYCSLSPLSDEELARILKIKPFAVAKARNVRGFNQKKLKETLSVLLDLELQFKSGVMSDETAVNLAVATLLAKE